MKGDGVERSHRWVKGKNGEERRDRVVKGKKKYIGG